MTLATTSVNLGWLPPAIGFVLVALVCIPLIQPAERILGTILYEALYDSIIIFVVGYIVLAILPEPMSSRIHRLINAIARTLIRWVGNQIIALIRYAVRLICDSITR